MQHIDVIILQVDGTNHKTVINVTFKFKSISNFLYVKYLWWSVSDIIIIFPAGNNAELYVHRVLKNN